MNSPDGICINLNRVYVTQYYANSLTVYSTKGKYIQSVGRKGNKDLDFNFPKGVAVSTMNNLIYLCDCLNNRIQCLNLNLTFNSFILKVNFPRDIKLTPQDIVVLTEGNHCIRLYDYSHQLIREIITQGKGSHVVNPRYFCLDREFNILITDFSAGSTYSDYSIDIVLIFSNRGELLHKLGKRGEGRGDSISPTGIATDGEGRIIVVSQNPEHCIQIF